MTSFCIFCDRVYENWPLYDILHEFQKGHSHMAVVIKNKKDVEDTEKRGGKHSVLDIDVNPHSNKIRAERKGMAHTTWWYRVRVSFLGTNILHPFVFFDMSISILFV